MSIFSKRKDAGVQEEREKVKAVFAEVQSDADNLAHSIDEVAERLKNDEMYMDIPIIAISSITKEEALKRIDKHKIEAYMQKDMFNQPEFIERVKEALSKYHV